jgi:hypothetical protein
MEGVARGTTVLLRRGMKSAPGAFERLVAELCRQSDHLEYRWLMPEPGRGPGAAFDRDNEMVRLSDLVLAFFAPGHVMEGGTGHVVETAIDRNVPVYSYAIGNTLTRVGENDPQALWQERLAAYFE